MNGHSTAHQNTIQTAREPHTANEIMTTNVPKIQTTSEPHTAIETADLSEITNAPANPLALLQQWQHETLALGDSRTSESRAMCLATCDKAGRVHARNVLLRGVDDCGRLWMMTDRHGDKCRDLEVNAHVAVTFLFVHMKEGRRCVKQVRVEGTVDELPRDITETMWNREPLYCKIRSYICEQGRGVHWPEHKRNFDSCYDNVQNGDVLQMPAHVVGYSITPSKYDFYYSLGTDSIADRLVYELVEGQWSHERRSA